MPTTMQLIAKQTVGAGGAASVTFSNIPQTYTDLKVVASVRSNRGATNDSIELRPNGSTSSRSGRVLLGDGSSPSSTTTTSEVAYAALTGNTATASVFSNVEIYCPNYTSSNNKSFSSDGVTENNATGAYAALNAWLWSSTAAITSLEFLSATGNSFMEFSEFWLYGISNSTTTQATTVPYASGGDVITTDGTYWYHAFKYSGIFTPLKNLTCDYLVVAGGGSGGWGPISGGGGAGGYRTSIGGSPLSLTTTGYTVTVGAGGAARGGSSYVKGNPGTDSTFSTITSTGGGAGGGYTDFTGLNGGSGGGAPGDDTNTYSGGTGTSGQGNNGGSGQAGSPFKGGGGGGAGSAGANGTSGGNGGSGSNSASSWATATSTGVSGYYAGGGGAGFTSQSGTNGTGGSGGGGAGGNGSTPGNAGTVNTGSGGGGGSFPATTSGAGGSGIIIVRYAIA